MALYNKKSQVITVGLIHLVFLVIYTSLCLNFWSYSCGGGLLGCLETSSTPYLTLILLSFLRPFFLVPYFLFPFMIGMSFPLYETFFLSLLSALCSLLSVSFVGKVLGRRFVAPWLFNNFPKTLSFIRVQDWKVILFGRLVPILPYDFLSLSYGLLDFRYSKILLWTFLGVFVEAFILSLIGTSSSPFSYLFLAVLPVVLSLFIILLVLFFKVFSGQKDKLYVHYQNMKKELEKELELTRTIVKREKFDPQKKPVLLLYGFFASRSSLTNLERILTNRGYQILSFNLGGLFEVFFTRGVIEAAHHLDRKLKELFSRHHFSELNIVAHSKGGLVALWWLHKLGGYKHCSKLITLGTPFRGSLWVWLGLLTPIGFFFRDLWQMRGHSSFTRYINRFILPPDFKLYSFYSNKDRVVPGQKALLRNSHKRPNVETVPMHHVSHYGYLHRKDIGDTLVKILASPYYEKKSSV